jgi:Leucine-rich repeat (LRR) protein
MIPINLNEFSKLLFLDLSHNSLTSLGPTKLQLPNLLKLHVSHNRLQSLDYLQFLFSLNEIDASSNKLRSIQHSVGVLISLKNSLRVLNLKNNPVCKKVLYEKDVLFVLPFISILDNIEVYKIEKFCNNKKQIVDTVLEVLNKNIISTQMLDTNSNITKNEKKVYKKKVMVNGNYRSGNNNIANNSIQSHEKIIPIHTYLSSSSNISYYNL